MTQTSKPHDRRHFLKLGGAGAAVLLGGCAGFTRQTPSPRYLATPASPAAGQAALLVQGKRDMASAARRAAAQVTDFAWLRPGDKVFLKVACNSLSIHPAVTCPDAVPAAVDLLRAHGAGEVIVGDQSGVEHVRLTASGRVSSTTALMENNGLLAAIRRSGATLHNFDDQGWGGYFRPEMDFDNTWQDGLWLPNVLREVDHVVNLARLSTHAVAGYTCAVKNAVGWLRDDSRRLLHQKGGTFFEKIAEINHAPPLRHRLRLNLTLVDSVLLNIGPDFGGEHDLPGCLALASTRLLDHDAVASALLTYFDERDLSFYDIYSAYPGGSDFFNKIFVGLTWGDEAAAAYEPIPTHPQDLSLAHDICLAHLGALQRYRPKRVEVKASGDGLPRKMVRHLRRARGGLLQLQAVRTPS